MFLDTSMNLHMTLDIGYLSNFWAFILSLITNYGKQSFTGPTFIQTHILCTFLMLLKIP